MKRIGIITFHRSWNYGSVLQAWALQDTLKRKGYEVEIIDYKPQHLDDIYSIFTKKMSFYALKNNLKRLFVAPMMYARKSSFKSFRNAFLNLSQEKYEITSNLTTLDEKYDCLISGSDQIWNIRIMDCDPAFFLPDVKKSRKIAYAVSVGNSDFNNMDNQEKEKYQKWISDYRHISVREKKTRYKLNDLLENDIPYFCALDPTLLHEKTDYEHICHKRLIPEKYIFLYNIWNTDDGFKMAKQVSQKLNCPVYTIMTLKSIHLLVRVFKLGIRVKLFHSAPGDYLSMINNSEFVLTDSFHGTAFSLIFEKPFVCINYQTEKGVLKNDVRLKNLLEMFGLSDRYVSKSEAALFDFSSGLNYDLITKRRRQLANASIKWLTDAIENDACHIEFT